MLWKMRAPGQSSHLNSVSVLLKRSPCSSAVGFLSILSCVVENRAWKQAEHEAANAEGCSSFMSGPAYETQS